MPVTSTFHYYGFMGSQFISGPSLSQFSGLPMDYILKREIVSDEDGNSAQNSQKWLFPPIYKLVDAKGAFRAIENGKFSIINIEADEYDYVLSLLIKEQGKKDVYKYKSSGSYRLCNEM